MALSMTLEIASPSSVGLASTSASVQYKTANLDVSLDTMYSHLIDARDEHTFGVAIRNSRTTNRDAEPGRPGDAERRPRVGARPARRQLQQRAAQPVGRL
jgi:hypothetical protein